MNSQQGPPKKNPLAPGKTWNRNWNGFADSLPVIFAEGITAVEAGL